MLINDFRLIKRIVIGNSYQKTQNHEGLREYKKIRLGEPAGFSIYFESNYAFALRLAIILFTLLVVS